MPVNCLMSLHQSLHVLLPDNQQSKPNHAPIQSYSKIISSILLHLLLLTATGC
nr:MAG TPA: hypothetical protein [Crassvirales sp.]